MRKASTNQASYQSKALETSRAINETVCKYRAETSRLTIVQQEERAGLLLKQREQLAKCKPKSLIDALVMVDCAKSIARVLLTADLEDIGHSNIRLAASELRYTLEGVATFLEKESGVTAQSLGLDPMGTHWQ